MVEQWSSKSHTWVRFLLLLSIENLFLKKSKNFSNPSIFFKIVNLKTRKPAVFLTNKTNKFAFSTNIFILNKIIIEQYFKQFFKKNNCFYASQINLFFKNLKKIKKYLCTNLFLSYNFWFLIDQNWEFYNFFLFNNFFFNSLESNFFKNNNFKKTNNKFLKLLFKSKKINFFTFKKTIPTGNQIFENFSKKKTNPTGFKFLLKKTRNIVHLDLFLLFSISKNIFNNKSSLNNYFKKYQTFAFQLDQREAISTKLFKISNMSHKLDRFQFLNSQKTQKTNFSKKNFLAATNALYVLNSSNQLNNFFFKKFLIQKTNFRDYLKNNKTYSIVFKILTNSNFSVKKNANTKFLLSLIAFLSKISALQLKNKNISLITNLKKKTYSHSYTSFFKKFNLSNFFFFFAKPFFFKIITHETINNFYKNLFNFSKYLFKKQYQIFFLKNQNITMHNNFLPSSSFFYIYKKKILKLFQYDKFPLSTTPFHVNSIIRFFEHCSGKSVIFKTHLHLNRILSYYEKSQCFNWSLKVKVFRRMLGPRLFLAESLEILYLTFKLKDPFFLSNWLLGMMKKISFWKYRLFFRYLKYVLRFFFSPIFHRLDTKGIKFQLKGKISVAGNARTRTLLQKTGVVGHSTFNNKIISELSLVPSFTGVMGLKVWIFF